jgi:hypothetical protein
MQEKQLAGFAPILLIFLLVYFQVFTANYFFSDDIHQLWYNKYASAYTASASQGRWISGFVFDIFFSPISSVSQLRYLHIFSLVSWVLTTSLWYFLFTKWANQLNLDKRYIFLTTVFITCCIPVAIYIGWASCIQLFIGICAGLLSGHFLLISLLKNPKLPAGMTILCIITGFISLGTYQNTFGMFLLPFLIYYLQEQKSKPARIVTTGIVSYCIIVGLYFLIFIVYSSLNEIPQNERARITTDVAGKLSFLFSDPLPMAFSVNFLYSSRSIFSQVLAPLMMASWAVSLFIRFKKDTIYKNFGRLLFILLLLILMYLPSMLASENFASYRTLFVLHLAVFYLLIDQLFFFTKGEKNKKRITYFICFFLAITGFYNFNFQFINPLKAEYQAFTGFMKKNMTTDKQTIYFIRADQFIFNDFYHTLPYKDEFGLPSTNKDWVPAPLIKQYMLESTSDRNLAEKIKVVQFADTSEYNNSHIQMTKNDLLVDMNDVFRRYMGSIK